MIYGDSTTHVEITRTNGGQFFMVKGVNPAGLDFLQPAPVLMLMTLQWLHRPSDVT